MGQLNHVPKPCTTNPVLCNKRSHCNENPCTASRGQSPLTTTRESPRPATKTQCSRTVITFIKLNTLKCQSFKKNVYLDPYLNLFVPQCFITHTLYHSTYKLHALCPFHWSPSVCNLCVFVSPSRLTYSLPGDIRSIIFYWILKHLFIFKHIFNHHVTFSMSMKGRGWTALSLNLNPFEISKILIFFFLHHTKIFTWSQK